MPKYWVKNYFAHGRFPEVGQKQKTEEKKRRERERERLNNGENNGQATHGARKHAWRTQAAWANTPGTAGGPGGRDRTLAVKSRKTSEKSPFFHTCLRAPCVAWPLLSPSFSLLLLPLLLLLFSPFFAFDPLRGNSHVRNNFSPNILA